MAFAFESIETLAADCVTPKTTFVLGEAVCARVIGAPVGGLLVNRRFNWVTPEGVIVASANITADPQTHVFTLPTNGTSTVGAETINNRGIWRVNSTDTAYATVRTSAFFTVRDPANAAVDLSLANAGPLRVSAGSSITYTVRLTNRGPDNAQNTQLTMPVPDDTTFLSAAHAGAAFACVNPPVGGSGATTCTIASLPKGAEVIFTFTYLVDSGVAEETVIESTATVSSSTTELHLPDNSSVSAAGVAATACSITNPGNITEASAANTAGVIVNYATPTGSSACGPITCNPASGSFFRNGTTTVTCGSDTDSPVSFTVTVLPAGSIHLTLNGADALTVECDSNFADPGAVATNSSGDSLPVVVSGSVDTNTPGTYTLTYSATEGENTATETRTVQVVDTVAPIITLLGDAPLTIECQASFTDPGATASDGCAGDLTSAIEVTGNVDPNTPGTYQLVYSVSDGTNTTTATRTVLVAPPTLTLNGPETMTVECQSAFDDPGATASDGCAGNQSGAIEVTGSVDVTVPGSYTLTYSISGGTNTVMRTVNVVDTTAPVITLAGDASVTIVCHDAFSDPGATATDSCAGSVDVTATGTVDTHTPGTYTLTYTATDGTNTATATRTVYVVDTTAPTITLAGDASVTIECHAAFADPGATATDECAGDLTSAIVVTGNVDVNTPGTYTLTYTVSDGTNTATAARTVVVVDTTPPVISCPANIVVTLPPNSSATSMAVTYPAATATDSCSGPNVTSTPASGSVFPVGTTTVNATATDTAGNTSSCSFTVTVLYNFAGFFSPVGNLPVLNQVNAGRAIPVKFSLSGNKGLNIFAQGYPVSGIIPCNATDPVVDVEGTVTAGGSSLSYDSASDQYVYVWKTESAWAGTCRQLVIRLNDGSYYRANFRFR